MSDRTLIHGLARALTEATQTFAGEGWPAALLWPDPERQWFAAFAELRRLLASQHVALYALGDDYVPDDGIGPAIWLRCLIEAPDAPGLKGMVARASQSVVLLPGVSWRDLREPLTLAKSAQMLVDMQYRGDVFRQRRQARDWTVATFLRDADQGLGLEIAVDSRTDDAAKRALSALIDIDLEGWRGRRVGADDFDQLRVPDEVRDVLTWLADPDTTRASKDAATWGALRDLVKRNYSVDIEEAGSLQKAVRLLIRRKGPWAKVWSRLADTPQYYRSVCDRVREETARDQTDMFEGDPAFNPHDNLLAEKALAKDLTEVAQLPGREAAAKIIVLEERHRARAVTLSGPDWAKRRLPER